MIKGTAPTHLWLSQILLCLSSSIQKGRGAGKPAPLQLSKPVLSVNLMTFYYSQID